MFDSSFSEFDLTKGGNIYSSVLYSMGRTYFGIPDDLGQYVQKASSYSVSPVLEGSPTRGLEHVGNTQQDINSVGNRKSVSIDDDGTYRLVVR